MLVIKPYGRTTTTVEPNAQRKLNRKQTPWRADDVGTLNQEHDFLIAHWISMIDKIICKPKAIKAAEGQERKRSQPGKATTLQRDVRQLIGDAALDFFNPKPSHAGRSLSDLTQWEGGDIFDNEDKASKGAVAQEFGERMKTIFGNDKESVFPSVWATDDALSEEARQL